MFHNDYCDVTQLGKSTKKKLLNCAFKMDKFNNM